MLTASLSLSSRPCDFCNLSVSIVFCRTDSAFLCLGCDSRIHGGGGESGRHARVWLCVVCEQAPATVTCRADAAALCDACDSDVHSANPLAERHERVPVAPFYDTPSSSAARSFCRTLLIDDAVRSGQSLREEEAEATSWLLSDPDLRGSEAFHLGSKESQFSDPDLDIGYQCSDGSVVPAVRTNELEGQQGLPVLFPYAAKQSIVEDDFRLPDAYYTSVTAESLSQNASFSSLDIGVVPEANNSATPDTLKPPDPNQKSAATAAAAGVDREARVMRYREKRKNRKFEKTVRYASRKAYAETRPRFKGRFVKRTHSSVDVDGIFSPTAAALFADGGYGIVGSF